MASIKVYPYASPRIVEVLDPATEINVQEVVDLVRDWEDNDDSMSFDQLIDAAGKESLGGGVSVGITSELKNGKLVFSQNTTVLSTGTCTTGDAGGGTLTDISATFETDGVEPGDVVINYSDQSACTVRRVVSETELECWTLGGGTANDWEVGDTYKVWDWEVRTIAGGNLVAVDGAGDSIPVVIPSFGTQVMATRASSATLQDQQALRSAIFGGKVVVDSINGASGTDFPLGTQEEPVDNWTDAIAIATENGIRVIEFQEDYTFDASDVLNDWYIRGVNHHVDIIATPGVATDRTDFENCGLSGTLNGSTVEIINCQIGDLAGFTGQALYSTLTGTITTTGTDDVNFIMCQSGVAGAGTPTLDMNGSAHDLSFRHYAGGIQIKNLTTSNNISLDITSGHGKIDSTCTAGFIVIRGNAKVTDGSTGSCSVDVSNVMNPFSVADQIAVEPLDDHKGVSGSFAEALNIGLGLWGGAIEVNDTDGGTMIIYDEDNTTEICRFALWSDVGKTTRTDNPALIVARTRIPSP